MWLLADILSWAMFLVGLSLLIVILLRRWHRYYGPRRRHREVPVLERTARRDTAPRSLSDAPPDILRWQVEMHETARDLKGELDTKISALQVLIRMAQQESERLERLIEAAESVRDNREA